MKKSIQDIIAFNDIETASKLIWNKLTNLTKENIKTILTDNDIFFIEEKTERLFLINALLGNEEAKAEEVDWTFEFLYSSSKGKFGLDLLRTTFEQSK